VYRAVDQHGQIIDVLVSKRRDGEAARRFFQPALTTLKVRPTEVVTDAGSPRPPPGYATAPSRPLDQGLFLVVVANPASDARASRGKSRLPS
jgi:DDE domain